VSAAYTTAIDIAAPPDEVFDHFVRPELLVRWMGDVARLDAVAGGTFSVDINGVLIRGRYLVVDRPRRLEIAWGELGNAAMPPGATRLVVTFAARGAGTHVELRHEGLVPEEATKHAVGWPHFLARLAGVSAGEDVGVDPWKDRPPQ
jgi:uncharacterized protein YndB with AHSA1/START domain